VGCVRCGCLLMKRPSGPPDLALALTIAATIAYVVANALPLMDLRVVGRFASTTIIGGAYQLWIQGERLTAALVAFCALLAPAGYLLVMLTLLLAARRARVPLWTGELLRWVEHLQVWSMLEVVMLGILVALVKIAELATVQPGIGMYAFGALVLLIPAILVNFDAADLWQRIEWTDSEMLLPATAVAAGAAPK
jgi:paraquat-inducible protein A